MFSSREEIELTPPTSERVAARAMSLCSLAARAFIDREGHNPAARELLERIRDWVAATHLTEELEPAELAVLATPMGDLSDDVRIEYSWMSEGAAVLAWSLGRLELPGHDTPVDPHEVDTAMGFLTDEGRRLLASPLLRPASEIDKLAERLFALHWRLSTFAEQRRRIDFEAFARGEGPDGALYGPLDIIGLPLIGGDLAIHGRPLFQSEERQWNNALAIAAERHRAANWLLGYHSVYSQVGQM